jgi:hypothetical protein
MKNSNFFLEIFGDGGSAFNISLLHPRKKADTLS